MVFFVFGLGPSWVLANCILQEIPYFVDSQPESDCIAAYINMALGCNFLALLGYQVYVTRARGGEPLPSEQILPVLLLIPLVSCLFLAFTWHIAIGGKVSLPIYLFGFMSGVSGGFNSVSVQPFVSEYQGNMITAIRSGQSFGIILTAAFAVAQSPGSSSR